MKLYMIAFEGTDEALHDRAFGAALEAAEGVAPVYRAWARELSTPDGEQSGGFEVEPVGQDTLRATLRFAASGEKREA